MNRKEITEQKVKYIREKIPSYQTINPYVDRRGVDMVTAALVSGGLYRAKASSNHDSSVINLILLAQGKKRVYQAKRRGQK